MTRTTKANGLSNNVVAYLVVVAGVCSALHIWKLPPALPLLQRELGLTLVESGFLLSIVQLGGMTLGLAMGLLAQQTGLRRCILAGLGLLVLASGAGALATDKTALMILRAIEGCGFLMVIMPGPALINRLVTPAQLSRVIGLWGCYIPLATIIALLGGSWLLSVANWQVLWWVLAAVTLGVLFLIWRLVPHDDTWMPARASERSSSWGIVKATLASEGIWLLACIFGLYAGQWIAVIGFLPTIYMLADISGTTAGVLTAIVAGSNAVGTFGAGRLLHRGVRPQVLMLTGFVTMIATAFVAFGLGLSAMWQFFAILVFSIVGGLIPTTLFLLTMRLAPTSQTVPTSLGWVQQISALGQFMGPPFVAWVATMAGGWQATWLATSSCAIVGILLTIRLTVRYRLKGEGRS